jgi:hypothetical protein
MKGHKSEHHKHHKHEKAGGGRIGMVAAGNPDVIKEAEGKEDYAEGDEKKHGGKVKMHKHKRKAGGKVLGLMTGGGVKPRADRVARKRGGMVGSDKSPMSSAFRTAKAEDEPKTQTTPASPE